MVGGFVGTGVPEEILKAIENQFISSATPNDLTLVYTAGIGSKGEKGVNRLGMAGLLKKVIEDIGDWLLNSRSLHSTQK